MGMKLSSYCLIELAIESVTLWWSIGCDDCMDEELVFLCIEVESGPTLYFIKTLFFFTQPGCSRFLSVFLPSFLWCS